MVVGALQRGDGDRPSQARDRSPIHQDHETIQYASKHHVEEGSTLYTDAHGAYARLA